MPTGDADTTDDKSHSTTLACPICESYRQEDYVVLGYGSQPNGVQHFPVLRCRRHGVEFADALPVAVSDEGRQTSLNALYGVGAEPEPRYVDFMDKVEAVAGSGGSLYDVGCGNGQLLFEASRRGWQVHGSDIVPGVKAVLESSGIRCSIGNLCDLDLLPEAHDVVTSFCVLPHHLTRPTPDMHAVARILKPGGWFVLQLPMDGIFRKVAKLVYRPLSLLPWGAPNRFSKFLMANLYGPGGHQFAYTQDNLTQYLSRCGFKECSFAPYYPPSRLSLVRCAAKPIWFRAAAFLAVSVLRLAGVAFRLPHHAIVYARKA
jgi:SAM-dependent methyltransferase